MLPLPRMRFRGVPRARALPRLRSVELAVRVDWPHTGRRACRACAAVVPYMVVARRPRAAQRGVPAAARIERANPEHTDARAAGRRLRDGRPDLQGRSRLSGLRCAGRRRDRSRTSSVERAIDTGRAGTRLPVSFDR
ncbi:hypothetical protein F01_480223 [Burkholderia cenocepacia]|nr:hypothetical protein F01_480223 [Burkholderia cenocepacia]